MLKLRFIYSLSGDFFVFLRMSLIRKKIDEKGFDETSYARNFHQHGLEYIRVRLRCLKLFWEGKDFAEIADIYGLHIQSCRKYINIYISGGFELVCKPSSRAQPCALTSEQQSAFKKILLEKRPCDLSIESLTGNIWTGKMMRIYLSLTYNVDYRGGIYDLLERLNLSHQKAHSDYGNAKKADQEAFLEDLKNTLLQADNQTAVIKFDEFSVCEKPTSYYGWAEKNTRPRFVTDEKKVNAVTD